VRAPAFILHTLRLLEANPDVPPGPLGLPLPYLRTPFGTRLHSHRSCKKLTVTAVRTPYPVLARDVDADSLCRGCGDAFPTEAAGYALLLRELHEARVFLARATTDPMYAADTWGGRSVLLSRAASVHRDVNGPGGPLMLLDDPDGAQVLLRLLRQAGEQLLAAVRAARPDFPALAADLIPLLRTGELAHNLANGGPSPVRGWTTEQLLEPRVVGLFAGRAWAQYRGGVVGNLADGVLYRLPLEDVWLHTSCFTVVPGLVAQLLCTPTPSRDFHCVDLGTPAQGDSAQLYVTASALLGAQPSPNWHHEYPSMDLTPWLVAKLAAARVVLRVEVS
jgi:hypothetical protein